jgi:Asp-tRNAAsn/Glu-tRNAGln amidotransferase B subunit (PET112 homolog)
MRSKEEAHDYRYFPDPDLLPLEIDQENINKLKKTIPELPDDRKKRYVDEYNLSNYDASVLTADKSVSDYFDTVIKSDQVLKDSSKIVANWLTSELFSLLNEKNIEINNSPVTPENLGRLVKLIIEDVISGKIAKEVLVEMFNTKQDAEKIIDQKGLKQVTDKSEIEIIVDEVLKENKKMVDQYLSGKDKLLGFFVGQSMKKSKGKANPKILNQILKIKLSKKN